MFFLISPHLQSLTVSLIDVFSNYIQQSQPKDKLADEELMPYINTLLYQEQGPWTIRISALLANISIESSKKRTVERSLKQGEEILKLITVADSMNNIDRYFSLDLPPISKFNGSNF